MQAFSALLGELDIDWEEELSRYTGDVVAHTLCSGARQARRFVGASCAVPSVKWPSI